MASNKFLEVNFTIEGDKQVAFVFENLDKELKNLKKPLQEIKKYMLDAFQSNIKQRGKLLGKKWKKLSPQYKKWKAKKYAGRGLLVRTGKLQRGFKGKVTRTYLELYNTTSYFKYHQSNQPRKKLPRRMVMRIDNKRRAEIQRFFTEFINEKIPRDYTKSHQTMSLSL